MKHGWKAQKRRSIIVTALVIDTDPDSRARISYSIGGEFPVLNASSVKEGITLAARCLPDFIVANCSRANRMAIEELRAHERITGTPLLLLSEEVSQTEHNPGNGTTPLLIAIRERLKYSPCLSGLPASQKA